MKLIIKKVKDKIINRDFITKGKKELPEMKIKEEKENVLVRLKRMGQYQHSRKMHRKKGKIWKFFNLPIQGETMENDSFTLDR